VNNAKTSWTAGVSKRFEGATLDDVKTLCGTIVDPEKVFRLPEKNIEVVDEAIPSDFDARTGFSECANVIGHIRDQANCGSCWAFGSTEAFNDRLCISTKGQFQKELSAQDTTSCCDIFKCFSMGCNGGQPSGAWNFFTKYGVVTGGDSTDKGTGDSCWPYQLDTCSHHVNDPKLPNCTAEVSAPACRTTCSESGYTTPFSNDKHMAKTSYSVSGVSQIQTEIMTNGPVTGAFTVYADFPTYRSGVYKHVSGDQLGGHAIKILGWGVENGEDYWLVANSWNADWGDNGYFKIARGTDECGIESQISAGLV
jgi:cathepsin B